MSISGGRFGDEIKVVVTYFYEFTTDNFNNGNWIRGPDFLTRKFGASCSLLELVNKSYILAAGGVTGAYNWGATNVVEILDLDTNIWIAGTKGLEMWDYVFVLPFVCQNFLL